MAEFSPLSDEETVRLARLENFSRLRNRLSNRGHRRHASVRIADAVGPFLRRSHPAHATLMVRLAKRKAGALESLVRIEAALEWTIARIQKLALDLRAKRPPEDSP